MSPALKVRIRPVQEGFIVAMHEGACETGSQILSPIGRRIWCTIRTKPRVHCDNKPRPIGLNDDHNMILSISPLGGVAMRMRSYYNRFCTTVYMHLDMLIFSSKSQHKFRQDEQGQWWMTIVTCVLHNVHRFGWWYPQHLFIEFNKKYSCGGGVVLLI